MHPPAGERRRFTRRAIVENSRRWVIALNRDEVLALVPGQQPAQPPSPPVPF